MNSVKDDPKGPGFPIRKSTDQRVLAPPRSLSQRATSFIASVRQGIHQMPLKRLIQRNPSRPGVNQLIRKADQLPASGLAQAKPREGSLVSAKTKPNPERELIRLRYSSPCPKERGRATKDPARSPSKPSNTPSLSQAAESPKSPLTTQFPIHTVKQHHGETTGHKPEPPNS